MTTPFTPAMASRIELWPLDRLKPYAKNARTHSDAQVAQIASSIVEYGFISPLLVSGGGDIMAGHGRLAAAQKLALDVVPVVVLDHLTPTQRRAYILADNALAQAAGWDEELLASELAELSAAGFDLALTGFSDKEIDDLLGDADPGDETNPPIGGFTEDADEDIPQAPTNPISRAGDIWQLGAHRLICGDSTDPAVVAAVISSYYDRPVAEGVCCAGEIGLSGEVRPAPRTEQRISEAARLGFKRIVVSGYLGKGAKRPKGIEVVTINSVDQLPRALFVE